MIADTLNKRCARGAFPLRVLLLVLAATFAVEALIMLALSSWAPLGSNSPLLSIVDASLLTTVLAPAIWMFVVKPLQSLLDERGALLQRLFDAQERERARIAGDLHDELGQQLTALLLALRAVEQAADDPEAHDRLVTARAMAAASLDAVRRLARGLAPVALHDLGLAAAAERLCEDVARASGLAISRQFNLPAARLPPTTELAMYRALQETLTNVARHANAARVTVRLGQCGDALELSVADDGRGMPDVGRGGAGGGLGLPGLRERLEFLKGGLRIESSGSRGTTVTARIPGAFEDHGSHSRPHR